eukprot:14155191-Alexandrium_andersonii.AAC.1
MRSVCVSVPPPTQKPRNAVPARSELSFRARVRATSPRTALCVRKSPPPRPQKAQKCSASSEGAFA